jgi:hypothetical protein
MEIGRATVPMKVTNFHSEKKMPPTLVSKRSIPPGPKSREPVKSNAKENTPDRAHFLKADNLAKDSPPTVIDPTIPTSKERSR